MVSRVRTRSKRRRSIRRKGDHSFRPGYLVLEQRTVLSTIMWNTTTAPSGGDWDTRGNWVGGVVPTASNNAVIDLTSSGTVTHSTAANDAALSLMTNGNTALSIGGGSITLGNGGSSIGSVSIGAGGNLNVAAGANVLIQAAQTLTDSGSMTIAAGASVGLVAAFRTSTQLVVNGMLTATGATFYSSGSNYQQLNLLQVNSGGELIASNTTFSIDQLTLAGGNAEQPGDLTGDIFNLALYRLRWTSPSWPAWTRRPT